MALELYHGDISVCSQKARIGLVEKGLDWISRPVDLHKGEHRTPEYLALNPDAVVPTLVHDGLVVRESSLIIDYADRLSPDNPLMPGDPAAEVRTRLWLLRTLAIHEAINSMTFATVVREAQLATRTAEELEAFYAAPPNPQIGAKRRDLFTHGAQSVFVDGALHVLTGMFRDMSAQLDGQDWLEGAYSLADIALVAYVDRLERLGMAGLWEGRFDGIADWLARNRARPSFAAAVEAFMPEDYDASHRAAGTPAWPEIAARLG